MLTNNYTQEEYRNHHVIIPSSSDRGALILGDLNAATDQSLIDSQSVRTIITAASGLDHLQFPSNLTHVVFPLLDVKNERIGEYF